MQLDASYRKGDDCRLEDPPSWFVVVDDRMVSPEYERTVAKRINATTVTITSGHVPMLLRPAEIAAVIIDAATKAGTR